MLRITLATKLRSVLQLLVTAKVGPNSLILSTLMMEAIHFSETSFQKNARITLATKLRSVLQLLVTAKVGPNSLILSTLMMEAIHFSETSYQRNAHWVTSQKTNFLIVTAVKASHLMGT
jgi:hypothetical protein